MTEARPALRRETREILNKSSGAIHMENKLSLLQRRMWNAMLYHAYEQLESHDEYQITVQRLAALVGYDSHDTAYLKESMRAMLHCVVEWNILDKDGNEEWKATALVSHVSIKRGLCTYSYSTELRRRLHNPAVYARLDLDLQKQFTSQYALALWELCTDALGANRDYGETRFIDLPTFRKLMGIDEGMYPAFMRLNEKVIKPAIVEVNQVTDFQVTMEYKRQGRKVMALKFKMRRVALLPEPHPAQKPLFPDLDDLPVVVQELQDAGLSRHDALALWQQGFAGVAADARPAERGADEDAAFLQYMREKIHLLKRLQASGKVHNSTGFLLQAIRENYANPAFAQENTRQSAAAAHQARRERDQQIKVLEQHKEEIEKAREQELRQLYKQLAYERPDILEAAFPILQKENYVVKSLYESGKSVLENYLQSGFVQMSFHPYLERYVPEGFAAIRQRYAAQIAALEAQIAALRQAEGGETAVT